MKPEPCDLSIITINANTRELVCQCLESVRANPPKAELEIIVVDNASTDRSCELIESRFPEVHVIPNSRNVGFAAANNQALEIARGEFLLLLNSDTMILPGSLDCMLEAMKADPALGAVSPRLVYGDGSLQLSYGPMPGVFVAFCTFFELKRLLPRSLLGSIGGSRSNGAVGVYASWFKSDRLPSRVVSPELYISGACMFIRRACYEQVGGLDPKFFMYVDDADYSKRIHDAGWKILYLADATVMHLQGGTAGRRYRWNSAPAYQSMLYFLKKHRGSLAFRVSKLFALAAVFMRWTREALLGRSGRKQTWALLEELASYRAPI